MGSSGITQVHGYFSDYLWHHGFSKPNHSRSSRNLNILGSQRCRVTGFLNSVER